MASPYSRPSLDRSENDPHPTGSVHHVDGYGRCGYCGSKLVYSHDLDLSHLEVIETGRCLGCGVAAHPERHTLQ